CKPFDFSEVMNPPAEPGALSSLAPQRGLIATERRTEPVRCAFLVCTAVNSEAVAPNHVSTGQYQQEPTAENVKLLWPPRQSRGTSLRVREWDLRGRATAGTCSCGVLQADEPRTLHFVWTIPQFAHQWRGVTVPFYSVRLTATP